MIIKSDSGTTISPIHIALVEISRLESTRVIYHLGIGNKAFVRTKSFATSVQARQHKDRVDLFLSKYNQSLLLKSKKNYESSK